MNTVELKSNPGEEIDILQTAHLREEIQTRQSNIRFNGQILGEGSTHLDVIPETYQYISDSIQHQGGSQTPESLQENADVSAMIDAKTGKITQPYIFAKMIENINSLFAESRDLPPTLKHILTGFYSNVDRICRPSQEKINQATDDAIAEGIEVGKTRKQVIQEIQSIFDEPENSKNIPTKVETKAQVIGLILRTFKYSISRASISDKNLADWIEKTFQKEYDKVGGASAQVADYLTSIGEENCAVYTENNSPDQAYAYKKPVKFLRSTKDGLKIDRVTESFNSKDLTKINYPIEIPAETEIVFNGQIIKSKNSADRIIFTTEYFDQAGNPINVFPLFNCSETELKQIASQYEYFIVNGLQYLQKYSPEIYQQIAPKVAGQLSLLKSSGVKTHYEISGDTVKNLQYIIDVVKGRISSMGTNHTELSGIVSRLKEMGVIPQDVKVHSGLDTYSLYQNALTLANYLDLERLHIHGHFTDIVLRKDISRDEQLKTEAKAVFHAKQRVIEWLKGQESKIKTPKEKQLSRTLRREGFKELVEFARQITANLNINYKSQAKVLKQILSHGYYHQPEGYSFVTVPVKWIYDKKAVKITTSSGDIMSYTAFIHSGL